MTGLVALAAGCTEKADGPEIFEPAKDGDAISFSVSQETGLISRSAYDPNNKYQIDWEMDDKFGVHCPQATHSNDVPKKGLTAAKNYFHAHYIVSELAPDNHSYHANIGVHSLEGNKEAWNGGFLQWNGDDAHLFYAAFPAEHIVSFPKEGVNDTKEFTMNYHTNQHCYVTTYGTDTIYTRPEMDKAYMMAMNSGTREGKHVLLDFRPIMTTLDINITADEIELGTGIMSGIKITGVSVVMPKHLKDGVFKYQLDKAKTETSMMEGHLSSDVLDGAESIYVDVANGSDPYVMLNEGQTLSVMVFLPPIPDLSGVSIKVHAVGAFNFSVTSNAVLKQQHRIDVKLPKVAADNMRSNNWMNRIGDDVDPRSMSLPGFSCLASTSVEEVEYLFKNGIRVFDISALPDDDAKVAVLKSLNSLVAANPTEFILVWHQTNGTYQAYDANCDKALRALYSKSGVEPCKSFPTTVEDCRGKMLLLGKYDVSSQPTYTFIYEVPQYHEPVHALFAYHKNVTGVDKSFELSETQWTKGKFMTAISANGSNYPCSCHYLASSKANKSYYDEINSYRASTGNAGIVMIYNAGRYFDDKTGQQSYGDLLIQTVIDCNYKFTLKH